VAESEPRLPPGALLERTAPHLRRHGVDPGDPRVELALALFRDRARTPPELAAEVAACLRPGRPGPREAPWRRGLGERAGLALAAVRVAVLEAPELDGDGAGEALERAARVSRLGRGILGHAVRLALTGRSRGPELGRLVALLGRDEVVRRLDRALAAGRPLRRPHGNSEGASGGGS
jgi:glutamyl-tRNA synthetase